MLIQFGESASLKKADANTQKEFVDRMNMPLKYQKKYHNDQTTVIPRVMLCRTSNDNVLFNDISINDGDRRNLLLVCKTPKGSCDAALRKQIVEDKDIIWVTAYKLYLENPEADLQLPIDMFEDLAKVQEDYKLIKNDDIKEIFDEIFSKKYVVNSNHHILSQKAFEQMVELAESQYTSVIGLFNSPDDIIDNPDGIPARWVSSYVTKKYGVSTYRLLSKYMETNNWERKQARYNRLSIKCWVKCKPKIK